ncbi:hypothetical protein P3S67_002322 [Capsicum chacoense]
MHDLVRDMGREIVRLESAQYPGKRSRLFIPEEVCDVLQGNNGSKNIEVLKLDRVGELKGVDLSTEAFKQMKKLRVLIINELRISGDFMLLSKEIRWLSWQKCPLNYIPPDFPAANLVVLDMRGSDIEEFGLNLQCCKKLKELNLSYCKRLSKTSNFSGARSLEILQLQYCNLSDTGIANCQRLVKITELDNLPSIESINMCNCSFLQNPFNEGFFSAPALSFPSRNNPYQGLQIYLECNEIPDWCSDKVTAPSICFTMPKHKYKFLGMVLWFICDGWNQSHFRYLIVTVAHKERFLTWNRHIETPILHGEVSRVYYISHSNRPFNGLVFNGGGRDYSQGVPCRSYSKVDHSYTAYPEEERDRKSSSLTEAMGHSPYLDINLPCVENVPDRCSVKVTAPSICFTMPTVHNNEGYKFLGMAVWFVIPLEKDPLLPPGYFFVTVSDKERERDTHILKQHEEVSFVYYISCSAKPYAVIRW